MSEKFDSDYTYCSEAEEQLIEQNANCGANLRRSQRLLVKPAIEISKSSASNRMRTKTRYTIKRRHSEDLISELTETISGQFLCSQKENNSNVDNHTKGLQARTTTSPTLPINLSKKIKMEEEIVTTKLNTTYIATNVIDNTQKSFDIIDLTKDSNSQYIAEVQKVVPQNLVKKPLLKDTQNEFKKCKRKSRAKSEPKQDIMQPKKRARRTKSTTPRKRNVKSKISTQTLQFVNTTDFINAQNKQSQIVKKTPVKYYNTNLFKSPSFALNAVQDSQLPEIYPAHFKNQLHPGETTVVPQIYNSIDTIILQKDLITDEGNQTNCYLTPDYSQAYDFDAPSTSTPSLPESLHGIFETNDIREILNAEKIIYRLNEQHIKALALVLNLKVEYLNEVINKIIKIDSQVLQQIEEAFANINDLYDDGQAARTRPYKSVIDVETS